MERCRCEKVGETRHALRAGQDGAELAPLDMRGRSLGRGDCVSAGGLEHQETRPIWAVCSTFEMRPVGGTTRALIDIMWGRRDLRIPTSW